GRPVVMLHVTDISHQNGAATVTRRRLESIGFNVDDKAIDWSTNLTIRARKEPPGQGGWNILHSWIDAVEGDEPRRQSSPVYVRLRRRSADRATRDRLGARDRSGEAQAGRRRDPEGCLRRGGVRPMGRVVDADGLSKERPRHPQIQCAAVLERADRVERAMSVELRSGPDREPPSKK